MFFFGLPQSKIVIGVYKLRRRGGVHSIMEIIIIATVFCHSMK